MHIVIPAGFFYPAQVGGPCNSLYWMSKALKKKNLQVTVVAMNYGINRKYPYDVWNDTEFGLVKYVSTKLINLPFSYVIETIKVARKADVVLLTSFFAPSSFIIGLILILLKKNVVWSPRGEFDPPVLGTKGRIKKVMLFIAKPFSEKIIFHSTSPQETNYIKRVFHKSRPIIELPNYLELKFSKPVEKEKCLLFVGRIHPKKAIENLIEGCRDSKHFSLSEFKLAIVGDANNNYGRQLKELVQNFNLTDKVLFLPHINNEIEKNEVYAKAYFSFLPSHTENFGNVVVESLAQGTPVVASKFTPWEILEKEKAGFWVDNSATSLADIIDKIIIMDEKSYIDYCINSRKLAINNFDINYNIDNWISQFKRIKCQV